MEILNRLGKFLLGYKNKYCIDCKETTLQRADFMVGWTCEKCNGNDINRELLKDLPKNENMIKVVTPQSLETEKNEEESYDFIMNEIFEKLSKEMKGNKFYQIYLSSSCSREVKAKIEESYLKAGWSSVEFFSDKFGYRYILFTR